MKYKSIKKLYYSISEISDMLDIKQSVIRYWESEFKDLKPQKNRAGNRIYKKDDIATLRMIDYYVHGKHLSIHEANEIISDLKAEGLYKRKLEELNEMADRKAEEETEEPEPLAGTGSDEELTVDQEDEEIPEPEKISDEEPEPEFEIVTPTEETFIYPLDELEDDTPVSEETIPELEPLPEPEPEPEIITVQQSDEENIENPEEAAAPVHEVPEVISDNNETFKSDPELRELLKKISGNIRDIIDILNE